MADCPEGFVKNPLGECVPEIKANVPEAGTALGGIDPNYKIPFALNAPWGTVEKPHKYITDDLNILYKISTEKLIAYQTLLMKAIPGYRPVLGNRADPKLKSVFGQALTQINALNAPDDSPTRGKSLDDALASLAANPIGGMNGDSGLPKFRLNDPDTLKKAFESGAQSALGRTLSPEDMNKLVNSFNQLDMNYQRAAAGGGGTTATQAPDAGVFAETQAEKMAPAEAEANDYSSYIGVLSDWMQG
jgi:hypothetical protein